MPRLDLFETVGAIFVVLSIAAFVAIWFML